MVKTAKYEVITIYSVSVGEEGVTALNDRFQGMMKDSGTIESVEDWGKRRLAYPINDELEGYYTLVRMTCGPELPAELDRVFKITDGVLRTMIIRLEDEA